MADIEKVLKGLSIERECVSRDCDRNCGECDLVQEREWLLSVYDDAIALLKEQDAVKPIVHPETKYHHEYKECGACGAFLTRGARFCSKCGRPVKWDEI